MTVACSSTSLTLAVNKVLYDMPQAFATSFKFGGGPVIRSRYRSARLACCVYKERFRIQYFKHVLGVGHPVGGKVQIAICP